MRASGWTAWRTGGSSGTASTRLASPGCGNGSLPGPGPDRRPRQLGYPALTRDDVSMAGSYVASGGWTAEVVTLSGTPDRRDGTWLRVRYLDYYVEPRCAAQRNSTARQAMTKSGSAVARHCGRCTRPGSTRSVPSK